MPRLCLLLSLLIASAASAVTMTWTPIGNPGNACDLVSGVTSGCFGAVAYEFGIGTYEVTNSQYAEFLNAKAAADPLGLYNTGMASSITRSGVSGSFSYSVNAGQADRPVIDVSFYDGVRFANWLSNGQGSGDTESGSYTLLGGTATPGNGTTVTRNASATIVLPSMSEWYKAAYYAPATATYFDYPAGSDTQTTCSGPTATANRANCNFAVSALTNKGSYSGSASPYGTFDQGGNAYEWNETFGVTSTYPDCVPDGTVCRGIIGGSYATQAVWLAGFAADFRRATLEDSSLGFRLAYIPEPGTGLLVIAGLLGIAGMRRLRA